jgi:hypothetical protein
MPLNSSTSSSSREILRLGWRALLLLALLFLCDRAGGALAEHWFLKTRDGDTGEEINSLLQSKSDVVVFGDSRAESHYSPAKLSAALGLSAFNGGYKGCNSIFQYGLQQLLFDHYTPRLIVLDFSEFSLMKAAGDPYRKLAPLHPYWRDPALWRVLAEQGRLARLYFLSRLYPYNSEIHSVVMFNILRGRPNAESGFEPQFGTVADAPLGPLERRPLEYSDLLVSYLDRFLVSAHDHHVPVVIVISPRHATGTFRLPELIHKRITEYSIPVLDFDVKRYPQFADYRLYHDNSHLNFAGAELFSQMLGEELCKLYCDPLRWRRPASEPGQQPVNSRVLVSGRALQGSIHWSPAS